MNMFRGSLEPPSIAQSHHFCHASVVGGAVVVGGTVLEVPRSGCIGRLIPRVPGIFLRYPVRPGWS